MKGLKYMTLGLGIAVVAAVVVACGGGETKIDPDMVQNPQSAEEVDTTDLPRMKFNDILFEFGSITQGEKVEHTFEFVNTGNSDLVIASARGSCGCTVPEWPKEPIPPGGKSNIHVVFDSEGKVGRQHKKVTIVANTHPATSVIALRGEVIAPSSEE